MKCNKTLQGCLVSINSTNLKWDYSVWFDVFYQSGWCLTKEIVKIGDKIYFQAVIWHFEVPIFAVHILSINSEP